MSLYLILEICSISIPLLLSFDKKVSFYRYWPFLFPSVLLTGVLFIILDIYFAVNGIWGFNREYHSGIIIASLPVEEWLFFFVIPYASIFIHYVISAYFPGKFPSDKITKAISVILILVLAAGIATNTGKAYTLVYFSIMILVIFTGIIGKSQLLNRFYVSFPVILIPFMVVNGILTGSFIKGEVVWYNNSEITGLRIFTIPVEDFAYGFSLIFINLKLMDFFHKLYYKNRSTLNEPR